MSKKRERRTGKLSTRKSSVIGLVVVIVIIMLTVVVGTSLVSSGKIGEGEIGGIGTAALFLGTLIGAFTAVKVGSGIKVGLMITAVILLIRITADAFTENALLCSCTLNSSLGILLGGFTGSLLGKGGKKRRRSY